MEVVTILEKFFLGYQSRFHQDDIVELGSQRERQWGSRWERLIFVSLQKFQHLMLIFWRSAYKLTSQSIKLLIVTFLH